MKPSNLQPYRDAVRQEICSVCLDHRPGVGGGCSRPLDDPCPLESHLDTVVESILSVTPASELRPYVRALRAINCTQCRQDDEGNCEMRDLVECAVDSYVVRVVEVIEDVAKQQGDGAFANQR
jgi:hypothetical protein